MGTLEEKLKKKASRWCSSKESRNQRVSKKSGQVEQEDCLNQVMAVTGWTRERAEADVASAVNRLGIDNGFYLKHRLWELEPIDQDKRFSMVATRAASGPWTFTLAEICRIVGVGEVPPAFANRANEPVESLDTLTLPDTDLSKYRGCFFDKYPVTPKKAEAYANMVRAIKAGAIVFTPATYTDEQGKVLPTIYLENAFTKFCLIGGYMRKILPMPSLAITGSVGKSTTVAFAYYVFSQRYSVFFPGGKKFRNHNTGKTTIPTMCDFYTSAHDFYVQEAGGGNKRLITDLAEAMKYDAFGITNIDTNHHLDLYGTAENLIDDKTSFDRAGNPDAVGAINADDPILMAHEFQSKIYTFGIQNEEADFVGRNIVQRNGLLEFDVDDHEKLTHVSINIPGMHNVYNALLVFALARHFGLTDEEIVAGFASFESHGIRQALYNVDGRVLYVDCFSGSSKSIISACETLQAMTPDAGGRRIAVVGGEGRLGKQMYSINYQTGIDLGCCQDIEQWVFVGPADTENPLANSIGNGRAVYDGAATVLPEERLTFISNQQDLISWLKTQTHAGDIILFEGSHHLELFAAAEDAFGTKFGPKRDRKDAENRRYYAELEKRGLAAQKRVDETLSRMEGSCFGRYRYSDEVVEAANGFLMQAEPLAEPAHEPLEPLAPLPLPRYSYDPESDCFTRCDGAASAQGKAVIMLGGEVVCNARRQKTALKESGNFAFNEALAPLAPLFAQADFVAAALEPPLSEAAPYAADGEEMGKGEVLNAPSTILDAVRGCGIDLVATASNHSLDAGIRGLYQTLFHLHQYGVLHTGTFFSAADKRSVIVDINGIRVAFLSYTVHIARGSKTLNWIGRRNLMHTYTPERFRADVADARNSGAEFIVAYNHMGVRYAAAVSEGQRETAREMAEAGADCVIGVHTHVLQEHETLETADGRAVPVFYGLGNLASDMVREDFRRSAVVRLELARDAEGNATVREVSAVPVLSHEKYQGVSWCAVPE